MGETVIGRLGVDGVTIVIHDFLEKDGYDSIGKYIKSLEVSHTNKLMNEDVLKVNSTEEIQKGIARSFNENASKLLTDSLLKYPRVLVAGASDIDILEKAILQSGLVLDLASSLILSGIKLNAVNYDKILFENFAPSLLYVIRRTFCFGTTSRTIEAKLTLIKSQINGISVN